MDLKVKPVTELGGPRLTWGLWNSAVTGIQEFSQKYVRGGVGLRMNFEILVQANTRRVDAQFAVGKGFLDMV